MSLTARSFFNVVDRSAGHERLSLTAPPVKKTSPFFKSSPSIDILAANQFLLDGSLSHQGSTERSTTFFSCRLMLGELFDPKAEYFVQDRLRPHWSQAGAIVFITARTRDSIPKEVSKLWDREKNEWLDQQEIRQGIPIRRGRKWSDAIHELKEIDRIEFQKHFNRKREVTLDECHGACVLRDQRLAEIVAQSLMHFDGDRYHMGDFVIMPNHFHLLVAFSTPEAMNAQIDSWLHYTATRINRLMGIRGHFWQQEPFDHLVRSEKQYHYLRDYIADNPRKANLREGEYLYRRLET